jgi:hypothetical protein
VPAADAGHNLPEPLIGLGAAPPSSLAPVAPGAPGATSPSALTGVPGLPNTAPTATCSVPSESTPRPLLGLAPAPGAPATLTTLGLPPAGADR